MVDAVGFLVAVHDALLLGPGLLGVAALKLPDVVGEAARAQQEQQLHQGHHKGHLVVISG